MGVSSGRREGEAAAQGHGGVSKGPWAGQGREEADWWGWWAGGEKAQRANGVEVTGVAGSIGVEVRRGKAGADEVDYQGSRCSREWGADVEVRSRTGC